MIGKKAVTTIIFLFSIFSVNAQSIDTIIKDLKAGKRLDKTVVLNNGDELEYIPLTVIKGKKSGPVYSIVAGIHGYEYPPIIAVQDLMKEIDPNNLQGTLIILPIANVGSFYKRSPFVNPIDHKNLNTAFPGTASGSITEKTAHWITKEIIPVSDVFIDIHGGDANEDLLPFICYYDNNDEQTEKAKRLSEASGMEYVVAYPFNITETEPAKYAFKQAVQNGIVALSIEAGKLGTVQIENVALVKNAVYSMLDYAGIYDKSEILAKQNRKYLHHQSYIRVPGKGIFYSPIKSGDTVLKDQNIGYITDDFGNVAHQITSPVSGIVLYKIGTPPVNAGETLFCIAY